MIEVATLEQLPSGKILRVDVDQYKLCLMNIEGKVYAIDDTCSHADFSLSEGMLDCDEKEIECPKHGAIFDVTTGQPRSLPATQPVNTYDAVIVDGKIYLKEEDDDA